MRLVAAILAHLLLSAHSWYPWDCCSDKDCRELASHEEPVYQDGGWMLTAPFNTWVADAKVKPSPDGKWHVCFIKSVRCVFGPKQSM